MSDTTYRIINITLLSVILSFALIVLIISALTLKMHTFPDGMDSGERYICYALEDDNCLEPEPIGADIA